MPYDYKETAWKNLVFIAVIIAIVLLIVATLAFGDLSAEQTQQTGLIGASIIGIVAAMRMFVGDD